jgi:hypothetical protein
MRKLGGFGPIAVAVLWSAIAFLAAVAILPGAARAQMFSEGYQFLEAVKERDGDTATEMLNKPGTQVVNTRDITSGDTGLHIAAQRRDTLWIRFLLQRGADPNIRNKAGATALQIATTLGHLEGVEELITRGADVNVTDRQGETPLISAVHQRNKDLIARLLKQGADPDRTDNSGRSARDYVELMTANEQILAEFEAADADRGDKGTKRQYGPSF